MQSIAKPARIIASNAMSQAASMMWPSSSNEVLSTNGDLVIAQNTHLSTLVAGDQQPYSPLMKVFYTFKFLNMKPSSASLSYNDPVATIASGMVNGSFTPAAAIAVNDSPTSFAIYNSLYPAGKDNSIQNAIRVRGFTGMVTITLTFTGALPESWVLPVSCYL